MTNEKGSMTFTSEFELVAPGKARGIGMPISEWGFLNRKIGSMRSSDRLFFAIANIFLGVWLSNGYLIKFTKIEETLKNSLLISLILTFLIGSLCLLFHSLRSKEITRSKEDILLDMGRIEEIYSKLDKSGEEEEVK